jgi:cation-transporting ATPase 13A1
MFTLVMLVFMECIGVSQRINNMQRLRDMAGDSTNVQVFRSNNWREIDSKALLPGDIVRVAAGHLLNCKFKINILQQALCISAGTVPADILLMSGTCVVNEGQILLFWTLFHFNF